MADTPRNWAILEASQARLQEILVVNDYRTDAGADVQLEPSQLGDSPRITLYSGTTVKPEDARHPGDREFTFVVEALVPAGLDGAHRMVVDIAEDIEQSLDTLLLLPDALPLQFQESLFLERPDGVAAMAVQIMFSTRYRR